MQFPESWLREFCNPPIGTDELAELLTMSGMEVEELRPVAPPFHGVVVGEVLSVERHPDADRLNVCRVDVGDGEPLTVVCGAPNVAVGMKVPCARVGAELPPAADGGEPFAIRLGLLRGVESQGMLCSARELKLSDDHGGLLALPADAVVGRDIREQLQLDDTLFTLKLTPNLAHGLSVYGIAREVAALTGAPLKTPAIEPMASRDDATLPVRVEAADLCGRFSGRIVRGVNPRAATPAWMVERLARCGQRSVTALVDISNYVMFETGQPTHIFDLDRIHGGLVVRWAREGETLELLNGSTVTLDGKVGVIADERAVESLAGIMGGAATAVSDATTNVYVEAAFWWPEAVAGRSRRFGFSTDAGHRFERGVDPALTLAQIERISGLIADICGTPDTAFGPVTDQVVALPAREPVTLRVARAAKVIGMPVTQAQCADALRRLGLDPTEGDGTLTVVAAELALRPAHRGRPDRGGDPPDRLFAPAGRAAAGRGDAAGALRVAPRRACAAPCDGRARLSGDDQLQLRRGALGARAGRQRRSRSRVANPIAAPLAVMRSSLVGSLLNVLRYNLARKAPRVRVFEIGRVFMRDASVVESDTTVAGVRQPLRLAGLACGPADAAQWGSRERAVDFYDAKGDVEALLAPRAARFVADTHPAMHPGPLRPRRAGCGRRHAPRRRPCRRAASALAAGLRGAGGDGAVRARPGDAARARPAGGRGDSATAVGLARPGADRRRKRHARRAARRCRRGRRAGTVGAAVRRLPAGGADRRHRSRRAQPGDPHRAATRRRDAHRRTRRRRGVAARRAAAGRTRRPAARLNPGQTTRRRTAAGQPSRPDRRPNERPTGTGANADG